MILSIDEVGEILDCIVSELPKEILEGLNGGVCLLEDEMRPAGKAGDYSLLLGQYFASSALGRRVELYYGSFLASFRTSPREAWEEQLKKTLYHELTHHLEHQAGCRDLEVEDEQQKQQLREEEERRAALRMRRRKDRGAE
ncbi:MAG: metallopeptidase family protein [Oscillospiraceae bacterium]|nr:metallopeptidase family protein [Oscillospiraceae bacterium]